MDRKYTKSSVSTLGKTMRYGAIVASALIAAYIIYALCHSDYGITAMNILIFSLSAALTVAAIVDIIRIGVRQYNVFFAAFYAVLMINNLNLSRYQLQKGFIDLYYFFVGPLIFGAILYWFDTHPPKPWKKKITFSADVIGIIVWVCIVLLELYVLRKTGIRFLTGEWAAAESSKYSVSGVSGLIGMGCWMLVMLIPDVKMWKRFLFAFTAILILGIIAVNRGQIICVVLACIMAYLFSKGKMALSAKRLALLLAFMVIVLAVFSAMGNARQNVRAEGDATIANYSISENLKSRVDNDVINWVYAYSAINFDVLKETAYNAEHSYSFYGSLTYPIIRIVEGNAGIKAYLDSHKVYGFAGINASTFLGDCVTDWGMLYFVPIILLGLLAGLGIRLSRRLGMRGGYAFLLMITALTVFGNNYTIVNIFYSFVGTCILYFFIRTPINWEEETKRPDFLIVYEHRVRELDNVCLLKAELENRGYSVEIININNFDRQCYRYEKKPKVLVTFAMYDDICFAAHAQNLVGGIRKVLNLQWEQAYSQKDLDGGYVVPSGRAKCVTHVCWGEGAQKLLNEHGVENACITGALQMDFLKLPLRNYYLNREDLQRKYCLPKDNWLLYISSFSFANMSSEELEQNEKKIPGGVSENVKSAIESKRETLMWFRKLLTEQPELTLIYRPHPAEHVDKTLLEMAKTYSNFRVISEGSVKQWILASDTIATWYSTSIAEIYYAGRSCMILRPVPVDAYIDLLLMRGGMFITDYSQMCEELKKKDSERPFPIPVENFKKYYGTNHDFAYLHICDLLEKMYHTKRYDMPRSAVRGTYWKGAAKDVAKNILIKLRITDKTRLIQHSSQLQGRMRLLMLAKESLQRENATSKEINAITDRIKGLLG